jgi:pyruvate dehydrogenase E2 component (dihydrolipoamide acetyltransferase)
MPFEFKLPDIGEGVVEGEIVKWLVKPGDNVEADQPMVEVMTDKATVVIPSPTRGVVSETRGKEGEVVEVHSVIVVIEDGGASAPTPAGPGPAVSASPAPAPKMQAPPAANGSRSHAPEPSPVAEGRKVLAAPATRRLARELGVDLRSLEGTGPAGRVTSSDVRDAGVPSGPQSARSGGYSAPAPSLPTAEPEGLSRRVPVRGLRRKIWENMTKAAFTAPHFTFVEECDVTELNKLRARFNSRLVGDEPKLTFLPFIAKAVVAALRKFPAMNGHVDNEAMEFVERRDFNLGIAVASDRGLIVPVLRNADRRSLVDLAQEVGRLADSVRSGQIRSEDLGDSTFTITSLGKDGGIFATPIINHPEVAILGVHKMKKTPKVVGEDIVIREVMNLSLSFDHRLIDGHVGAAFTYAIIQLLEDPDRLMLHMG